ncbi:hypothetical protein LguiA_014235 [Lonicera macranthoides]
MHVGMKDKIALKQGDFSHPDHNVHLKNTLSVILHSGWAPFSSLASLAILTDLI